MKKSIIVLLTVLLLSACGKSISPEDLLKNAYNRQSALFSYSADATVKMDGGAAGSHEFDYLMKIEKGQDRSQADDIVYLDFSCTVEGDDPYSRWTLGNGTVLTDTGSEKYRDDREVTTADLTAEDRADKLLSFFETIETENSVIKAKVKEESQNAIVSFLMDHLFFNVLVTDMFGDSDLVDLLFTDLSFSISKQEEIEKMIILGKNINDIYSFEIDIDFSDFDKTVIPAFDENEFLRKMAVGITAKNVILSMDLKDRSKYDLIVNTSGAEPLVFIYDREIADDQSMICILTIEVSDIDYFDDMMTQDKPYFAVYEREELEIDGYPATLCYAYYTDQPDQPFGYLRLKNEDAGIFLFGYSGYERYKEVIDLLIYQVVKR
ncbi:MAG: hypothetical protein IKS51_01085 [Erysipelotrichaceae bacterium]|nr:hypothetical protein [Erysipelotrichaceae bacterium]